MTEFSQALRVDLTEDREETRRFLVLRRFFRSPTFVAGFAIVVMLVLLGTGGVWLSPYEATGMDLRNRLSPPTAQNWFGTDNFGRDVFTRVAAGSQLSMFVGLMVVAINAVAGAAIGALAGYLRQLDNLLMRVMDAFMAFPAMLLAIAITAALGPSLFNVVVALAVAYVPKTARIVRGTALIVREQQYVEAAQVAGAGTMRILRVHVLPNCLSSLVVQLTFVFASAVLAEATLSYLGVGLPPPAPTWGNGISDGREYIVEAWWISLFPGLAITFAVLGFNFLGDGLRDVLDPHLPGESE
ncbi:ABC transporter permease [Nitratireductor pacificus]|uniref:Peptide ABC transporter permease n=1 Tax=Nitratireductor pacificus pht-3B TaxID=391937 RepID=K2MSX0_9HYPH|nr:peptide ABC transporter permease [Nitratireductor pacificus pht-3B]